jgi:hypothetical protein
MSSVVERLRAMPMPCPGCGRDGAWRPGDPDDDEEGVWGLCLPCGWMWDPAPFEHPPSVGEYAASDEGALVRRLLEMVEQADEDAMRARLEAERAHGESLREVLKGWEGNDGDETEGLRREG